MNKNYILSPEAEQDLSDIWLYIAKENFQAANNIEDKIVEAFSLISDFPNIAQQRPDLTHKQYRFYSIEGYFIIYNPDSKPISILRILNTYRDIEKLLN